jgi:glycerophosphoryl diester phosphodiesterase
MQFIAHRGASGYAPENTMAAFRLALSMGAKAIELDIHQTKDHRLVVIHDFDLKRVAKKRVQVKNLSLEDLGKIDIGTWFDTRFSGERAPLLTDVLDLVEGKAELHIELKRGASLYHGIEEHVLDLIQKRKAYATTLVSSFDHTCLYRLRSLDSKVRLGYLVGLTPFKTAFREMGELKAYSMNISMRQANAKRIKAAHARGLKVLVYTVNLEKDIMRMDKLGADGVFCNFPDRALA